MMTLPNPRYHVPDFSPRDRGELKAMSPCWIFVAESPHVNEVESEDLKLRRPLCGAAGKQWWSLVSELLEGHASPDVSYSHILSLCLQHRIAVMNAVQSPLDPAIARLYPDAEPVRNLGFRKGTGPESYKRLKAGPVVQAALQNLHERLTHPALAKAPVFCLGNDAEWFVTQALSPAEAAQRVGEKIPHPSAWWRRGGLYGELAREKLEKMFRSERLMWPI